MSMRVTAPPRGRLLAWLLLAACALPMSGTALGSEPAPTHADEWAARAAAHVKRGRFAEGISAYNDALALDPEHVIARLGRADALYRSGSYDAALRAYSLISELAPGNAVAHYMRGLIHARRGNADEAIAAQEAAVAVDPGYAAAHYQLGSLRAGAGHRDSARASLEQAVRLAPHMPEPYYALARLYRHVGDIERASTMMQRFRVENARVETMARLQETLAVGDAADRVGALVGLGLMHIERDELDAAESRLRAALPAPEAHAGLARVALARERFADAVASYTRAFDLGFDAPQARYNAGLALMRLGDGVRAMAHLLAAIDAEPDMADAHLLIGTLHAARRDTPRAAQHYERAIELDEGDAVARHGLAYLYGREGVELTRAVTLAREATRLAPRNPLYHNTLAWLLLKSGDYDAAEQAARRAVELAPENDVYQAGLSAVRQRATEGDKP